MSQKAIALALMTLILSAGTALADDWLVTRVRGTVVALADTGWQPVKRGTVIADDRAIRTLERGHIELVRGKETIALSPNTQVRIVDKAGKKPFTTVRQDFGIVEVEAEVRNVKHFAVITPQLAAVVKGTRFIVRAGEDGNRVEVKRGQVFVESGSDGSNVTVAAGQQASATPGASLEVAGRGDLPQVLDRAGKPVDPVPGAAGLAAAQQALADAVASGDRRAIRDANRELKAAEREAASPPRGSSDNPGPGSDKPGKPAKHDDDSGKGKDDKPGKGHDEKPAKEDKPNKQEQAPPPPSSSGPGNSGGNSAHGNSNGNGNSGSGNSGNGNGHGGGDDKGKKDKDKD